MSPVFLLLGTNLGDRLANLAEARLQISRHAGAIITTSAVYKTAAWGKTDQPEFLNQAVKITPITDAQHTLALLLDIEKNMGRVREEKWGNRVIDIDILLWGNRVIREDNLHVPHIQLPNRRFALKPLADIARDFTHPVLNKTIAQLLTECEDTLSVEVVDL